MVEFSARVVEIVIRLKSDLSLSHFILSTHSARVWFALRREKTLQKVPSTPRFLVIFLHQIYFDDQAMINPISGSTKDRGHT